VSLLGVLLKDFRLPDVWEPQLPSSCPSAVVPTSIDTSERFQSTLTLLKSYTMLRDNWNFEGGRPMTHEALNAGIVLLNTFVGLGIVPEVSPLGNGGVLFDVDIQEPELAIDVSSTGTARLLVSDDHGDFEFASSAVIISEMIRRRFQPGQVGRP
jgi:hypothetical protein